jgi:hypothetical protein
VPARQKEKDSTEHPEHENANHPAGPKHLKDAVLNPGADHRSDVQGDRPLPVVQGAVFYQQSF